MAENKSRNTKLNFNRIINYINALSLSIIIIIFVILTGVILLLYFQYKETNNNLLKEKKEKIYGTYVNDIFQKILLLSYSSPFLSYLHAGETSRNLLEIELLKNFNMYVSKELIGYKLFDHNNNFLSSFGKESDTYLILELCYLNNTINPTIGRCKAYLHVFFNFAAVLKKISNLDASWNHCSNCYQFEIKNGAILNGIRIIKNNNFVIPYEIKRDKNEQLLYSFLIALIFLLIFVCIAFYINGLILKKYIIKPVSNLFEYVQTSRSNGSFLLEEIFQVAEKVDELRLKIATAEREKQQAEFMKLAQVAHDIRSPLAALNVFLNVINELPEDKRILARNAIYRIQDIANNLVKKQQNIFQSENKALSEEEESIQLISSLVESLISEKRMQYTFNSSIKIEFEHNQNAYNTFAKVQPNEFKRMLSNLINNSFEAIENEGKVILSLSALEGKIHLKLKDTGIGIPENILPRLMEEGHTYNKKGGTGLGLSHANKLIKNWGGSFSIQSQVNYGTTISMSFAKAISPAWFLSKLSIPENSLVVVVDDDESIHSTWKEKFKSLIDANITLQHFIHPSVFFTWYDDIKKTLNKNIFVLCDYEFMNSSENGVSILRKLNISDQSVLVSSKFDDSTLQIECEKFGVKLIPKCLVYLLPIFVEKEISRNLNLSNKVIDSNISSDSEVFAVLIDDDIFMHDLWKLTAKDKCIVCFQEPESFFMQMHKFSKDINIYIDSSLSGNKKGEDIAKEIYQLGFKNIYLATGYNPKQFPEMPWIKEIRDKTPPWLN